MSRPVVGICAAVERAAWGAWDVVCNLSPRSYSLTVQAAGALALLLPPVTTLLGTPLSAFGPSVVCLVVLTVALRRRAAELDPHRPGGHA